MRRDVEGEGVHRVRRTSNAHARGHFAKKFYDLRSKSFSPERMPKMRAFSLIRLSVLEFGPRLTTAWGLGEYRSLVWMIYGGR